MSNASKTKNKLWLGILVLVFANTAATGAEWCSSALADISANFPDTPYWIITLINNIPNLCAVFFTILAGILVNRKIPLKTMMLLGIGLGCIGGFMPVVFSEGSSIIPVLLSRFVFGIGYGIMQGISVSMAFKLVQDSNLRDHAIGWTQSAQFGMNMFAQIAVGYLVAVQWNYSFFIYLWFIVPFIVVAVLCPKFPLDKDDRSAIGGEVETINKESVGTSLKALPPTVWIFAFIVALYMVCFNSLFLNIAPIIVGRELSDAAGVGYAMTFFSVSTIVAGLLFGTVTKKLRHFTLFAAMLLMAAGLFVLKFAYSYVLICVTLFICGLGSTCVIPACMSVYGNHVPAHRAFIASSVTMAAVNVGAFLGSPYVAIFEALGYDSGDTMVPSAIILVILGIVSVKMWKDAQKRDIAAKA